MDLTSSIGMLTGASLADQIDTFSAVLGIISFGVLAYRWMMRGWDREVATRGDLKRLGLFVADALSDQLAQSLTSAERRRVREAGWLTQDQRNRIETNMLQDVSRAIDRALEGSGDQAKELADDLFNGRTWTAEDVLEREAKTDTPAAASDALHLQAAMTSLRDIDRALAICRRAVELTPHDALGWSQLAQLYLRNGDMRKAQDALQRALLIGSSEPSDNQPVSLLDHNTASRDPASNGALATVVQ